MQPQHVFYHFELVSSLLLPPGVTFFFLSSSVEDDSDTKRLSKEDKGRSLRQSLIVYVASALVWYISVFLTQMCLCVLHWAFSTPALHSAGPG